MTLNTNWFPKNVPSKPSGYYAHIIMVRETNSYAVFQTDGELNTARVGTSTANHDPMTRLTIFKRKQTTPERLKGRELLRRYDFLSDAPSAKKAKTGDTDDNGVLICDYNEFFCKQCPDCITYGFAIGDSGSEKSKVITDTAYSLTNYASSHETFTLNAPYESGTMSREGDTTSRINEADHVKPQVFFPTVLTIRDVTAPLFVYVLNNVLRTKHYGAQTTRTGSVSNHILGIVLTDGEIFSNLQFCQKLFGELEANLNPPNPLAKDMVLEKGAEIVPALLRQDNVTIDQHLQGDELATYLQTIASQFSQAEAVKDLLESAFTDSRRYHQTYISPPKKK